MKIASKAFLVVMALQVLALGITVHTGSLVTSSMQTSSGCHEHGQKNPVPAQGSYVCCLNGHDSLILQSSILIAPASNGVLAGEIPDPGVAGIGLSANRQRLVSSGDPPTRVALRI